MRRRGHRQQLRQAEAVQNHRIRFRRIAVVDPGRVHPLSGRRLMILMATSESVPTVFKGISNTVALIVLLLEFGMLRASLLRGQVRLYAGQSLAVSILAAVIAFGRDVPELYALAALSLLLKAVVVPLMVVGLLREA